MIVTRVGGLPDLVPDEKVGLVVNPEPTAIADGIIRFFEMGRDHFLPALREEKKKYGWGKMLQSIRELANIVPNNRT